MKQPNIQEYINLLIQTIPPQHVSYFKRLIMKKLLLVILFFSFLACSSDDDSSSVYECLEGTTIGKIRSNGGGLAVSLQKPIPNAVTWQGHQNVVELLNIPEDFADEGSEFYFSARLSDAAERGIVTADGDETIELILYGLKFNVSQCP